MLSTHMLKPSTSLKGAESLKEGNTPIQDSHTNTQNKNKKPTCVIIVYKLILAAFME